MTWYCYVSSSVWGSGDSVCGSGTDSVMAEMEVSATGDISVTGDCSVMSVEGDLTGADLREVKALRDPREIDWKEKIWNE